MSADDPRGGGAVPARPPLTGLLQAAQAGDREAADVAYRLIYDELQRLARAIRRDAGGALGTLTLVHEAWLKLAPAHELRVESRAHFKHIAARAMRMIVVDEARRRGAQKRSGGHRALTLDEGVGAVGATDPVDLLELDRAVAELEEMDARAARVIECRVFGGLDVTETADALGVSTATVKRDFRVARAFLAQRLS